MTSILDHYKILGVTAGAGIADITSSYKRLCRTYHPDVNDDPESEELMKRINIAYAVLREKLTFDASFRERQSYSRPVRRYGSADTYAGSADVRKENAAADDAGKRSESAQSRMDNEAAEREAFSVLDNYFKSISMCDYSGAYNYLSGYDKRYITRESYIQWRKSVARLYPMRGYRITGGLPAAAISFKDGRTFQARRFRVAVTEDNYTEEPAQQGDVEKLVIKENRSNEHCSWKVFLGYKGVGDLTRSFDEKFEKKRKRDITKRWEDYYTGLYPEYDMLSLTGLRKAASREIYRQRRFGGTLSFAAISIKAGGSGQIGQEELLRSAAKTIAAALRETDVPAYTGDGVFAILFVGLCKKNIDEIVARLVDIIRKNAGPQLGWKAAVEYEYESWQDQNTADMDEINKVLKKFHKKV